MAVGALNPKDNAGATSTRPAHVSMGAAVRRWFTDSGAGTRPHAQDLNAIIAQFRGAMDTLGITDNEGDDTILTQLLTAARTPRFNHARNPSLDIWQFGTSAASGYVADFWKARTAVADQVYSRQAGFSGARYCVRLQRTPGAAPTGLFILCNIVDTASAFQLAGKKVVVSADVRCGADFSGSGVICRLATGTGIEESPAVGNFATGSVVVNGASQVPSTTAQRMIWPFAETGATISELLTRFDWTSSGTAGANDWIEVTNVKIEEGSIATPFVAEPPDRVLAAAQRHYQKSFVIATTPAQNVGVGTGEARTTAVLAGAVTQRFHHLPFPVRMRSTPTVTLFNPAAVNANVRDITGAVDCSAPSVAATERGIVLTCTGNAATAVGNSLGVHYVADARGY